MEVFTSSTWRGVHGTAPLPIPVTRHESCLQTELLCMVRSSRLYGFLCPTFKDRKLSLKIKTHLIWWVWMHMKSSKSFISPMLWPVLVWIPLSLRTIARRWGIGLPKGLLASDFSFEQPSGLLWIQGFLWTGDSSSRFTACGLWNNCLCQADKALNNSKTSLWVTCGREILKSDL